MQKYAYSPDTGELIATLTPSDWMEVTDVAPPDYDSAKAGCFWRNGQWEIVLAQPIEEPVPKIITMRQARLALLQASMLDIIDAAMISPEDKIWWDYSTIVERENPLVLAKTAALGVTSVQLDALFKTAATL